MLLAIDAGNTHTVFGLFNGRRLKKTWRVPSQPSHLRRFARRLPQVCDVIVSSVVPSLRPEFVRIAKKVSRHPPLFVQPTMAMPIRVRLKNPREAGQDRIVNAVAAYTRWKCGLIIVDLGTATTCDVVTPKGDYIGGTISPGIGMANRALHEKTALLPLAPIKKPRRAIGNSTVTAIQSGVYYGYIGLIDGLITRLKKELRFPVKIIATGGLSSVIAKAAKTIDVVDPNLTLRGLQRLHEWNRPRFL